MNYKVFPFDPSMKHAMSSAFVLREMFSNINFKSAGNFFLSCVATENEEKANPKSR